MQTGVLVPRQAKRDPGLGVAGRVGIGATLVAVLAASVAAAALLLWLVSILLPIALGAAAVAYLAFRLQFSRGIVPSPHPAALHRQGRAGA